MESKRHPFRVRGSDVEAGNENALALVRSCGNLYINYVLHQLDHNKPFCRVKVWGGTPDMLREFRNSVGVNPSLFALHNRISVVVHATLC